MEKSSVKTLLALAYAACGRRSVLVHSIQLCTSSSASVHGAGPEPIEKSNVKTLLALAYAACWSPQWACAQHTAVYKLIS